MSSRKAKTPKPGKADAAPPASGFRVRKDAKPLASAKPSAETIRQLYMASKHVEWSAFAKDCNWNALDSRHGLPVSEWIEQKRKTIAQVEAEKIAEAVFQHKSRWHTDVLKTLKEYPEANDAMFGILKKRLNDIIQMINVDNNRRQQSAQTGTDFVSSFDKVKNGDLVALATAMKIVTESKHRALMIDDWSFKVAESYSDPKQFGTQNEKMANLEWKVSIMGGENLTSAQMQEALGKYYDRPLLPHDGETIEANVKKASGDGS